MYGRFHIYLIQSDPSFAVALCLIYIAGDGLGLGFFTYTEIGSGNTGPSLCNVNMFCIVQCSHRVWKPNLSLYQSPSQSMSHHVQEFWRERPEKNRKYLLRGSQGSHSDWKTWENGKAFSSQGILNRLEKSGKITQNTGKLREFEINII